MAFGGLWFDILTQIDIEKNSLTGVKIDTIFIKMRFMNSMLVEGTVKYRICKALRHRGCRAVLRDGACLIFNYTLNTRRYSL
jgi:hypothetical protein